MADEAIALTPATRRRDTITRQLQREILGEAADVSKDATPDELTSPESSSKKSTTQEATATASARKKTPEKKNAANERGLTTPPSGKRRTLSPSKAALISNRSEAEALDAAVSRRDTVSPTALRSLLEAEGGLDKSRNSLEGQSADVDVSPARSTRSRRRSQEDEASPARSTRSLATKRPLSASKKLTSLGDDSEGPLERRGSMNTSDSFTDSMFAPNLLEQNPERRPTLDPTEAASVVAALQKEARSLSNTSLELDDAADSEEKQSTPPKTFKPKSTPSPTRTKTSSASKKAASASKKASPAPKSMLAESKSKTAAVSKYMTSPAQKNKSPAAPKSKTSPAQAKSTTKRRATVDPSDVLNMLDDSSLVQEDRRQTIDDSGLLELNSAFEAPANGNADSEEASRKRSHDADSPVANSEKRSRVDKSTDNQEPDAMVVDSNPNVARDDLSSRSPSSKNRQEALGSDQNPRESVERSPDERMPSRIPKPSLFSPPPGGTRVRTPLKGILSARKSRKPAESGVQTTPNKSVNFGPSQGAEFNHGSPSTSMTPMCAKDTMRLYPSEPRAEEPDDEETSLNSSILDEADSVDDEESTENDARLELPSKIPVFDHLQRRSSLLASKPSAKNQRRHSMRGYSPLDNQAEARRRRRRTINGTQSNAVASIAASSTKASSQSPPSTRNNSFLMPTTRTPYADSSASSDAGEDMEITGDYTNQFTMFGRNSVDPSGKQMPGARTSLPRDDDTTEFNTAEFSLGRLLTESAVYELTKSAPEPELPGTLGDLANEVAEMPSSQGSSRFEDSSQRASQDVTLDPIREEATSRQSMMSLETSDDSDTESRQSVVMNLSSQFDRVSPGGRKSPSKAVSAVQLITMEELLSVVAMDHDVSLEADTPFFGNGIKPSIDPIAKNVKVICAYNTSSEVIKRHSQDVSNWSSDLSDELASLLDLKAPALFSPENLGPEGHKAIKELHRTEKMVARSGWCQFRAQMEKQLVDNLSSGARSLADDVKSLKAIVSEDSAKREQDLVKLQEMIAREEQMSVLFDAIEEQQGAQNEYESAVKELESQCSSLLLEESVLQSRLNVLEGRAAELEPVTSAASTRLEQEVLAAEELLTIQDSLCMWRIQEATASLLRLSSRFQDVLFDVEVNVEVNLASPMASTSVKVNETLKRRQRTTSPSVEDDVVLVLQRLLLDPRHISQIADESDLLENVNDGSLCSKLQVLENFLSRSFRLLCELRELSTHFLMRFDDDNSTLWIDFFKFPSTVLRIKEECVGFCVGFSMVPTFPYTDFQTLVKVTHGQVSREVLAKEIELVPRESPKYFSSVCHRLHESFVR